MNKQDYIERCVDLLDETYTRQSGVMQNVIRGLNKMSKNELSSLYSVLLTRVVVRKI